MHTRKHTCCIHIHMKTWRATLDNLDITKYTKLKQPYVYHTSCTHMYMHTHKSRPITLKSGAWFQLKAFSPLDLLCSTLCVIPRLQCSTSCASTDIAASLAGASTGTGQSDTCRMLCRKPRTIWLFRNIYQAVPIIFNAYRFWFSFI